MFERYFRLPIYISAFGMLLESTEGSVTCTLVQYAPVPGKQAAWTHFPDEVQRLFLRDAEVWI